MQVDAINSVSNFFDPDSEIRSRVKSDGCEVIGFFGESVC